MQNTSGLKRGGRGRGAKRAANKLTTAVKAALWKAFQGLGGVPALEQWGREHPTEFYNLWAQLLHDPPPTSRDTPAVVIKVGMPLVEQFLAQPLDAQQEIARAIGVAVASAVAELAGAGSVGVEPESSSPSSRVH